MKCLLCLILCVILSGCAGEQPDTVQGMGLTYQGTRITIQAPAAPVLEALGEAKTCTQEPSCAFEGMDKTYFYGSFYLTTYPAQDGERILGLWFADDGIATDEGITIGSRREEVEQAYGAFTGDSCQISGEEAALTVMLEGDAVTGVRYDACLE